MTALDPMGPADPMGERRKCHAHKKDGTLCRQWAMVGTVVCALHGGKAPQVLAAAKRRLLEAVDPAAKRLIALLASTDEKIALAAARDLLDRAGLGARIALDLGGIVPQPSELAELSADEAVARAMALMDELALARQRKAERLGIPAVSSDDAEIVDAEIVEES